MNFFKKILNAKESVASDVEVSDLEVSLQNINEQYDTLNQSFEDTRNELLDMTEKFSNMEQEFIRVSEENKNLLEQIENLKVENEEIAIESADIELIAANKAVEIVAECGTDPIELIEEIESDKSLTEQLASLKGTERTNFFNAHRKELIAALKGR